MNRRTLLRTVLVTQVLIGAPALGKRSTDVALVGLLVPAIGPDHPLLDTLRRRLRELGYIDGQNIRYEFRGAEGQLSQLPRLAQDLVQRRVDVILAATEPAVVAARNATTTIPIVMVAYALDPAASGLIDTFGRPGGNVTGVYTRETELLGKRLELLKEMVPNLTRIAVLWDSFSPLKERDELRRLAPIQGVQLDFVELGSSYDIKTAFGVATRKNVGAALTLFSPSLYMRRGEIAAEAIVSRLPLMSYVEEYPQAGGLMSYGTSLRDIYYRVGYFIDRLLRGAKPSDLPVEQAPTFRLVVNLKTAKAIGLTIPQSILLRADDVIG